MRNVVAALALAWMPLAGAQAQNPPPVIDTVLITSCKTVCDVVSGVVYDSLVREPLAGALVVARPSGITVTTDSVGRFLISSEERVNELTVYHEALDNMGLGALVTTRPANAATWTNVTIATPSLLTIWPKICGGDKRPVGLRAVVLSGSLRLADNNTRVSGAKVLVQWPKPPGASGDDLRSTETVSDSLGNFLVCGVEEFAEPSLLAISAEAQSGIVTMPADSRPLRRVDLVLGRLGAGAARASLRGIITNNTGIPLRDMRVGIDGREGEVVTGSDGTFTLDNVPLGSRMLSVRSVGYSPLLQVVDVLEADNARITIPMEKPFAIEGVTVTARSIVRRDRQEFEMRRRAGWGRFVDSTAINRVPFVRQALQSVPGVNVTTSPYSATEFVIRGRRGCPAIFWVDGVEDPDGLVQRIPKENIAAIEVYPSSALAPGRYVKVMADDCPVVLFWTKNGLRP